MKQKYLNVVLAAFFISMISVGCNLFGKDNAVSPTDTNTGSGTTTQRTEVDAVLAGDDFYKAEVSEMLDEPESDLDLSPAINPNLSPGFIDSALPTAIHPAGWRRQRTGLTSITKDYQFDTTGDTTTCLITVTRNITGILHVDTTFDHVRNPGSKNFADTITYKFYLEKRPNFGWKLVKISPREMKLTDTSKQKVYIDKIEIQKSGQTYTITSPSQMLSREDSPRFDAGEKVTVMATVRNISPGYNPGCFVFLHHFNVNSEVNRVRLYDDGTNGDITANDNIFTNTFYMHGPRYQHAAIDVLDSRCLQNQAEDDYNSNAWGIPYRIIH